MAAQISQESTRYNSMAMFPFRASRAQPLSVVRVFFFLWFAGGSFMLPFLPIFYQEQGLSGFEIGMLASVGFAMGMLAAPLWGRWTDRISAPHRLLQLTILLYIGAILLLSRQTSFWPIAGCVALYALVSSSLEPVANTLAVQTTRGTRSGFGSVRVWGSIGWAVLVIVAGWWIERTSIYAIFQGFTICMLLGWLALFFFHRGGGTGQKTIQMSASPDSPTTLRMRPLVFLFFASLMGWWAVAGVRQFEPLYFKLLGAGEQVIGFSAMLSAVVELPGMFWADSLVRRFGAQRVLILGFLLDAIFRGMVMLYPSVPLLLASRAAVGISFSLTTVGLVSMVQECTPLSRQTGAIALYTVVVRNMVFLFAYPLAGVIFDSIGALWLYAIALAGNLLAALILFLFNRNSTNGLAYNEISH